VFFAYFFAGVIRR